jgi:hypothetical protein
MYCLSGRWPHSAKRPATSPVVDRTASSAARTHYVLSLLLVSSLAPSLSTPSPTPPGIIPQCPKLSAEDLLKCITIGLTKDVSNSCCDTVCPDLKPLPFYVSCEVRCYGNMATTGSSIVKRAAAHCLKTVFPPRKLQNQDFDCSDRCDWNPCACPANMVL